MLRKAPWLVLGLLCGLLWAGNLGCVVYGAGWDRPVLEVRLDDDSTAKLFHRRIWNTVIPGPDWNHAALYLLVESDKDGSAVEGVVATRGSTFWWQVKPFELGELEARADERREKVWLLDKQAKRVVASLDRVSGAMTGPADPAPSWATLNGGEVLE